MSTFRRLTLKKSRYIYTPYLGCIFAALLFEVDKLHHLGHDEALLKVSVDLAGRLWSFAAFLWVCDDKKRVRLIYIITNPTVL